MISLRTRATFIHQDFSAGEDDMLPTEPGQFVAAAKIPLPLRRHEMIWSDVAVIRKPLVHEREVRPGSNTIRPFLIAYPAENGGNAARRSSNASVACSRSASLPDSRLAGPTPRPTE